MLEIDANYVFFSLCKHQERNVQMLTTQILMEEKHLIVEGLMRV